MEHSVFTSLEHIYDSYPAAAMGFQLSNSIKERRKEFNSPINVN